jgi:hypothetical protein
MKRLLWGIAALAMGALGLECALIGAWIFTIPDLFLSFCLVYLAMKEPTE